MRGEHLCNTVDAVLGTESSPHTRGAPPARVLLHVLVGSSPHTRGAHVDIELGTEPCGIIPACAGSTSTRENSCARSRDHPRMREEHEHATGVISWFEGSSPHARGARISSCANPGSVGIIPACAGSTRRCRTSPARWWDHPRMRGEHQQPEPALPTPPGIIPACAGSTRTWARCSIRWRDRPRMRGEHSGLNESHVSSQESSPHARGARVSENGNGGFGGGSSPHARGAPSLFDAGDSSPGIIPACAGST